MQYQRRKSYHIENLEGNVVTSIFKQTNASGSKMHYFKWGKYNIAARIGKNTFIGSIVTNPS